MSFISWTRNRNRAGLATSLFRAQSKEKEKNDRRRGRKGNIKKLTGMDFANSAMYRASEDRAR